MRKFVSPLLVLLTCAAVAAGLVLPWAVSHWQNRDLTGQRAYFPTPQITLGAEADLLQRLELASRADHLISLSGSSPSLTEAEALEAGMEALGCLAAQGFPLFAPDRWTPQKAETFLLTGGPSTHKAALAWDCRLENQEGDELGLLVDDDLGLVLSFAYQRGPTRESQAKDPLVRVSLSQETSLLFADFCRDYYGVQVLTSTAVSKETWALSLCGEDSETYLLPLSASSSSLFFNSSPF